MTLRLHAARAAALALPLALALGAAPALAGPADPPRTGPDLAVPPNHFGVGGDTKCDRCHTPEGWNDVAFAHERTGFPLRAAHARIGCKACHAVSFTTALGRDCISCHKDVHQGRLGARCAGCHDEASWRTRFDADAHRRGNFPLTGRHAFIACEECHGDRRDRTFARPTTGCVGCHLADYERTRLVSVDHAAAGFPTACQSCHQTWRWKGAGFPQHGQCFNVTSGPHAGISCLACHTSLASFTVTGACNTGTAACTRCHTCASHPQNVAGFACAERKCYECHQFASAAGLPRSPAALRRAR